MIKDQASLELTEEDILNINLDQQILPYSYYEFFKAAWGLVEQETFVDSWAIEYICNRLQRETERIAANIPREKHLVINIPPRFGKSNMVTSFWNAWTWINYPHIKFISISYSASLSEEHNIKTKELLESQWYQLRFGGKWKMSKRKNSNKNFRNDMGGARIGSSISGGITGKGASIFIFDDPINPEQSDSEAERKKTNRFIDRSASSRLNNPSVGVFIYVQQRVHEQDAVGHVLSQDPDKYESIILPAEDTFPVSPPELKANYVDGLLDPTRFSRKTLRELKTKLGSQGYAGQYGQQPKAIEGNIIKESWLQVLSMQQYMSRAGQFHPIIDFFVDTAYTENERNDPTAMGAMVYFGNCIYILNVKNEWMELPQLKRALPLFCINNGYDNRSRIIIEPKASGLSVYQELKDNTGLNVVKGVSPKSTKTERVNAATPFMESGRLYLVDGSWNAAFIDQLTAFPNAANDDMVDITTMARERYDKKIRAVT